MRVGIASIALAASALSVCSGVTASPKPYDAAFVEAAFARSGMTSYLTQSSGSHSSHGSHEGDATITSNLAPHCPLPNDFFSTVLSSSALVALESRRTLIFTSCHQDWVAVVFFRTTAAASNELRATRRALARSHIMGKADRNVVIVYRVPSASEAAAALRTLH